MPEWFNVDLFLFIYASWAFVRIGDIQYKIEELEKELRT